MGAVAEFLRVVAGASGASGGRECRCGALGVACGRFTADARTSAGAETVAGVCGAVRLGRRGIGGMRATGATKATSGVSAKFSRAHLQGACNFFRPYNPDLRLSTTRLAFPTERSIPFTASTFTTALTPISALMS